MTARPSHADRRPVSGWVLTCAVTLFIYTVVRVVLWVDAGPVNAGLWNIPAIFGRGLVFDLATLAFAASPLMLLVAMVPNRVRTSHCYVYFRWFYVWLAWGVVTLVGIAEFLFWNDFTTRFNFIAVDYLVYRREVVGNIKQSYPVGWTLVAIGVFALVATWSLSRWLYMRTEGRSMRSRLGLIAGAILLPALSFALVSADQMEAMGNAYADELVGNGTYTFVSAYFHNDLDYHSFYRTLPQPQANDVLESVGVQRQPLDAVPMVPPPVAGATSSPLLHRPRNIVLISIESMSAQFLGVYGNQKGLTPNLDRLTKGGISFDHFFATGTRTVRGLEALSAGIPPVPGQSIVRRPGNDNLATIGGLLAQQGYSALFVYGGYGVFDNMNDYFRANYYGIVDRSDFDENTIAFANVWGVADESLFTNSIAVFDKVHASGKPFFAHIMTTSNHRPFTYPDGRIDIKSPGGRDGGVKYTDYAIGKFIEDSRKKPWFDDTLFVITADHCAAVAGQTRLPVADYRIPLILYAPALVKPQVIARVASQIDVPPTLLALLGVSGQENFFGEDLFAAAPPPARAFISNYQDLGYYKDGTLTVLSPRRKVQAFTVDPHTLASTPRAVDPQLENEAIAYYQTAERAFKQRALALVPKSAAVLHGQ